MSDPKQFRDLVEALVPACVPLAHYQFQHGPNIGGREVIPELAFKIACDIAEIVIMKSTEEFARRNKEAGIQYP